MVKYGFAIGATTQPVAEGGWIHSHNLRTQLEGLNEYVYRPVGARPSAVTEMPTFEAYRRADGRVGTRNEVWILNTVGCVNFVAEGIAKQSADRVNAAVDGVYVLTYALNSWRAR